MTRALLAALRAVVEQINVLTEQITEQLLAHADAQGCCCGCRPNGGASR